MMWNANKRLEEVTTILNDAVWNAWRATNHEQTQSVIKTVLATNYC